VKKSRSFAANHNHNISGWQPNACPTNGVFGPKIPEFVIVQKWHFFYNFRI